MKIMIFISILFFFCYYIICIYYEESFNKLLINVGNRSLPLLLISPLQHVSPGKRSFKFSLDLTNKASLNTFAFKKFPLLVKSCGFVDHFLSDCIHIHGEACVVTLSGNVSFFTLQ